MNEQVILAPCPVCEGFVELANPFIGEQTECPDCQELLRVQSLEPLMLGYAYDIDEEPMEYDDDWR